MADSHLYAVQQVRRLRGGCQSQLLRASDGAYYVVKPSNNPQHVKVLANEMFGSRLGGLLRLPMPRVQAIDVSEWLIENTSELRIDLAGSNSPWKPGLHLASLYVDDPCSANLFDYLPEAVMEELSNLADFARVLVFDRWTCNSDGRQAVFSRGDNRRPFSATFIDQGYCFNGGDWNFPDSPLRGVYARNFVYQHVRGWESFEPALTRVEQIDVNDIWRIAAEIPCEWYEHDSAGLSRLIETLCRRRPVVRDQITAFRHSTRNPFPKWQSTSHACA